MVLWGGGAVALLRQLRVRCFEEWCWHGRAEKLRGTVQCQGRGEGGVWLCWTLSCQTHPLGGVCWWRLPRRYREVPWFSLLVPGSAETVTLCVMHCLMSVIWSRTGGWDGSSVSSSIQWELQGSPQPVGRTGQGSERGGPASPAVCHSAAAFWGRQCRDHSLPGWDPSCHRPVSDLHRHMWTYVCTH